MKLNISDENNTVSYSLYKATKILFEERLYLLVVSVPAVNYRKDFIFVYIYLSNKLL